ncbi:MAG: folate-binding protein [Proteobacteria bacterium]|nr:folate-binding protein [Pseudomonadota bacterium]
MTSPFPAIAEVACIVIEGTDARRFAQAQFSGDVDALAPGHWQWNAWLTPQGRVRALMHLANPGDGRLLAILRGGDADVVHAALSRYVLRMDVTLGLRRFAACAGEPGPARIARAEPDGTVVLGYGTRSLRLGSTITESDPVAQREWKLQDIRQGWPRLPPGEPEFLPPALGLEHLGAVAFGKGCYPGQEMAARLHYRGGHKYRLCHLRGAKPLAKGPWQSSDGTSAWVLEAVAHPDKTEALIVAPHINASSINGLYNEYQVVSIFDT